MFDISKIARPNILRLEPYRCARDDFQEGILLDANENSYGPSSTEMTPKELEMELNRYPDPHQILLKQRLCNFRNSEYNHVQDPFAIGHDIKRINAKNVCLSLGSDGGIDLVIRCFVKPSQEKILVCPPSYPMYGTYADLNDVTTVEEPLDLETFQIKPKKIIDDIKKDPSIKLVFITSPGNPTATQINIDSIFKILDEVESMSWNGLIVVDEAYIDFCPQGSSMSVLVNEHKNLVVLQTFSKAFALAGIRLGAIYSAYEVSKLLNTARDPYSQSKQCIHSAMLATTPKALAIMKYNCKRIGEQRSLVMDGLSKIPNIGRVIGGTNANFILVQVLNKNGKPDSSVAHKVYWTMATNYKVVVRYRGDDLGCTGCLRITIGKPEENKKLLKNLANILTNIYDI